MSNIKFISEDDTDLNENIIYKDDNIKLIKFDIINNDVLVMSSYLTKDHNGDILKHEFDEPVWFKRYKKLNQII